jgi:phage terminase small subunit
MARPRKPTAVLELTGAFKKDPQRKRENEPQPNGPLGEEPLHFDEELAAIWRELVAMVPARVLALSDRWLVELACRTMQQVRKGTALAAERNLLLSCLSRMGLTPADRSKIAVPQEKEELDELAKLAAECRVPRPN